MGLWVIYLSATVASGSVGDICMSPTQVEGYEANTCPIRMALYELHYSNLEAMCDVGTSEIKLIIRDNTKLKH